ncbi:hypothetical protein SAMN05421837_10933 [Amycolatopsis pretoriensis]|uniref:Uncharacterized protein n=1 Tax=Amycolatopsis pretoriensis TaxID=218821 RepID=A0A1H5RBX1_9PSEU|nr:hypothetical protein [Amycolatopsis pretoriensis]SEF35876.1 hypothetical protein SAMN05421837_10933 [Amycolatopsis pretoriensis]
MVKRLLAGMFVAGVLALGLAPVASAASMVEYALVPTAVEYGTDATAIEYGL